MMQVMMAMVMPFAPVRRRMMGAATMAMILIDMASPTAIPHGMNHFFASARVEKVRKKTMSMSKWPSAANERSEMGLRA